MKAKFPNWKSSYGQWESREWQCTSATSRDLTLIQIANTKPSQPTFKFASTSTKTSASATSPITITSQVVPYTQRQYGSFCTTQHCNYDYFPPPPLTLPTPSPLRQPLPQFLLLIQLILQPTTCCTTADTHCNPCHHHHPYPVRDPLLLLTGTATSIVIVRSLQLH